MMYILFYFVKQWYTECFSHGDHLFEKPGSVQELDGCQENVF